MPASPDLARLYDAHASALFGFLLQLTRDEGDTRDLLQDVFVKLARRPGLLDGVDHPRAFLLHLAHNAALDLFRRRSAQERRKEELVAGGVSPFARDGEPDAQAFRTELAAALTELPIEQRAVVHLKLWEGLTFAEIATALDLSANTAASRYRYGLDKLRARLRPILPALDKKAGVINMETIRAAWGKEVQPSLGNPLNAVSVRLLGPFERLVAKGIARGQAYQNMAVIACALERWSLAHGGGYPDSTTVLVPELLTKLPVDPVNGQPLHYRRTADGRFQLWSVGANLTDEGGTVTFEEQWTPDESKPKPRRISSDPDKGDWVWSYQKL
ncbi:MAG: sigma-70 family RNA polymerase sigma factor [Verrucomicrobiota bacterium]